MTILLRILCLLCLWLLAAHFLRFGDMGYVAMLLALSVLAFVRARLARYLLMAALAAASFVWADTLADMVALRRAMHMEWTRLAVILGSVLFVNLSTLFLFCLPPGRKGFRPRVPATDSGRNGQPESMDGDRADSSPATTSPEGAQAGPHGSALQAHAATRDTPPFLDTVLHHRAGTAASAFLLTVLLLVLSREMSPFAILLLDRFAPGWGGLEILLLAAYASLVAVVMLDPAKARPWRSRIWGWFSRIFFLQLALGLLGLDILLMTGDLHLPVPALILAGPLYRGHGLFMLVLFLSTVALAGPAWCSHLCYIGAWDHGLSGYAKRKPPRTPPYSPLLTRLGFLALVIGAALAMRQAGVPGQAAAWLAAIFGVLGVGVMVLASRRLGVMVHCTAFCPLGVAANLLGKLTPWRMRMDHRCHQCMACSKACRYLALTERDVARKRPGLSCTLCGDCVSACRDGFLHYHLPGLSPGSARTAFIVLVVSLHACFLGVARM